MYGSWLYINKGETTDFTVFTDRSMTRYSHPSAGQIQEGARLLCYIVRGIVYEPGADPVRYLRQQEG